MKPRFSARTAPWMLAIVLTSGLAITPATEAAGRGGGGAHAREHSGGGAQRNASRPTRDTAHRQADARTNNVRNTSVNNVNVNRNVNVNVDNHGGYPGGWDDDYHPVATAAAVTATVAVTSAVVGSIVRSVPANCVPVNYRGMVYQQCGSTWYQPQGTQFVVVNAPY